MSTRHDSNGRAVPTKHLRMTADRIFRLVVLLVVAALCAGVAYTAFVQASVTCDPEIPFSYCGDAGPDPWMAYVGDVFTGFSFAALVGAFVTFYSRPHRDVA